VTTLEINRTYGRVLGEKYYFTLTGTALIRLRPKVKLPLETVAEEQFDFDVTLAFPRLWPEARPLESLPHAPEENKEMIRPI
jgi:hypothetical protein